MKEIFEQQMKLNLYIMNNIGENFDEVLLEPEKKSLWIENCRKALSSELAELVREVREFGTGTREGKVEVVDILHFLVTLSQLVGVGPDEPPAPRPAGHVPDFDLLVIRSFLALDDLQNSLKWKWWAKGGGYKPEKARLAVLELWSCFHEHCAVFGLSPESVKEIYQEKNRLNFARQDLNYNEDEKKEDSDRTGRAGVR